MKSPIKNLILILILLILSTGLKAQQKDTKKAPVSAADSLLNSMDAGSKSEPVTIFKSTRLVLSQTTETVKKGNLNFQIIHRFGDIAGSGGPQTAFGIDRVNDVYFGFEYGVSDNFNVDIARSTIGQLVQLELKYALLHQTSDNSTPFALTLLGEAGARPYASFPTFSSRLSYVAQAILARKFSPGFSFQLTPTFIRDNTPYPVAPGNEQQFFALQGAARFAINKHMGFILDYAHPFSSYRDNNYNFKDPLGIGYEVETGGHVFTLNVTNANSISEINYLSNSQQRFSRGQYRIGFTISRMFDLRPKHKDPEKDNK
ncbi:MAG TPA: DUF5777 family beta-barrel protein [Mucilaginibacter sp.]